MFRYVLLVFSIASIFMSTSCSEDDKPKDSDFLETPVIRIGDKTLSLTNATDNTEVSLTEPIKIQFAEEIDVASTTSCSCISLRHLDGTQLPFTVSFDNNNTMLVIQPDELISNQTYFIEINTDLKGAARQRFEGVVAQFTTSTGPLAISSVKISGTEYLFTNTLIKDVPRTLAIEITFSFPIDPATVTSTSVRVTRNSANVPLTFSYSDENRKLTITSAQPLAHLSRHEFRILNTLKGIHGEILTAYTKRFYTVLDPTPKKDLIANDEDDDTDNTNDLLSVVQQQTFKYFYDFAEPNSGMARERNTSGNLVTSGGSGFGIMALIVGMERNFISREQGLARMDKIVTFLETADRFHGAWSHWINGTNGDVIPFGTNDNGGDLVETAFLVEGLITFRQYLNSGVPAEQTLINRINTLWQGVDWEWYRKEGNENVLYWHWSPDKAWIMNHQIKGWNECLITYVLAASAPTPAFTIPKVVYESGWASNGGIRNTTSSEGLVLPVGAPSGGPLFFTHYSFVGMNPTNLSDQYANYWTQNVNHSLINYRYCVRNPKNFVGYSDECWGLTASDNHIGYNAHSPTNDLGVITPTAALSSFPYTPTESMRALKFFYYTMGDRLWGNYGFYDAFNVTENWYADSYLAIDQGPIIVMIENYRTGLLWDLFMSAPEVQAGLTKLEFSY
jgi:hypothetical protein